MLERAAARGADAVILDLEDGVAEGDRPAVRDRLPGAIAHLHGEGASVLVRVNSGLLALYRDLAACVRPGLRAVVLSKAERPERVAMVAELLADLEAEAGLPLGETDLIPLIETAAGLLAAPALAVASHRVTALAFGGEDLALDLGGEPSPALLTEPARQLVWAARAGGRAALGLPGSIGNISDPDRLRAELDTAARLGCVGALCVHPAQIDACHAAFAVSAREVEQARRIIEGFERAGTAVCVVDGQMVDRPVVSRARTTLARWRRQSGDSG